ncbi:NAD(P)H-quinone oxidoreductase [Tessaracoccus lapidicaptus]|uniref:NAD(P)H-quinone oxidoreductase n=1 Tax=Tessaracoccus lapidicaptus TaxID=1427523 RepID=A0A1C0AMM0_9ACTN|nr:MULTISPECIES: NAD(P)H-quinone oxidoreductase [Tessaracoccus]AQX15584.1 NAD(P)H-quinone oxidoreductase [Tessaracoccus sp. T2.5-30]OCL33953.1 NAD(P)H-quinone oxidoreductase [Tessaracoccus lapidicaptus]VEP39934.1 Quinone oxidoreductase 1 [Tessaracoccus lapidicaptus]
MRAVIVTSPGDVDALTLGEMPTPSPGPGEVLVRTIASGVNRADVLQRQGHYPPPPGVTDVIGLEASGVVAGVGAGVERWREGDEVVALLAGGGYAEYFVAPEGQLIAPPPGVDLVSAAGVLEVAATVLSNLRVARLAPGEVFLVHGGAGGIGTFATQYAKAVGATVVATAGSAAKLDHCRAHGADHAFDYHDDWVGALKEATGGADVILDIIGAKYLESNVAALRRGGRIVVIGLQGGAKGTLNLGLLLAKQGTVAATSLRFRPAAEKAEICAAVESEVWPMLADGRIRLSPETRMPFDDVRRAHTQLVGGDNVGKIVLVH